MKDFNFQTGQNYLDNTFVQPLRRKSSKICYSWAHSNNVRKDLGCHTSGDKGERMLNVKTCARESSSIMAKEKRGHERICPQRKEA